MSWATFFAGGCVIVGASLLVSGSTSCSPAPDSGRVTEVLQPDFKTYAENVDFYLQRRCGTLDCHGQPGRSLRLYGQTGFRLYNEDAGLVSGQQPTTDAEKRANFQAIVALEPEEMSRLIATQGAEPNKLILLRKPLLLERHKGGPSMAEDDAGYKCVVNWLRIPTIRPTSDGLAFEPVPPEQRISLTPRQKQDCTEAQNFP